MKKIIKGSSETTRETLLEKQIVFKNITERLNQTILFDFNAYIQNGTPKHKPCPNKFFLEWFIGFFEAEGSLITWFDKKQRFEIEITQKDPKLMYKIKQNLGWGNVTSFKKHNQTYWRYQTSSAQNINRFILLLNGNLATVKKIKQFQLWVHGINKVYETNYLVLPRSINASLNTAWLAGFLEADGGFWVSSNSMIYKAKDGLLSYRIRMKFYITQKSEHELLNQIKTLFKIPTKIYQITNSHSTEKYNRLETSLLICHQQIIDYLEIYPFMGQRNILFQRWSRLMGYRTKNYPITEKSIKKYKQLIKSTKNNFLT